MVHTPVTQLREASLSHLTRKVTEARSSAMSTWIREHSGRRRRYRPPRGGKMRKALAKERKETARRFHQLLSGHAATGEHLLRANQVESDECFWCRSGERQTRFHCLRGADGGDQRSETYGEESGWRTGGGEHHLSAGFLGMRGMYRQSWSFLGRLGLGKCQAGSS